ncbi:MAG: SDR family NAD(P)-dependent oxidoreductase, partial [Actinomycetota bacterium]|nr:SDR family NAD(P)-dependent oxidoreductase [Actinomycetota bacterium]
MKNAQFEGKIVVITGSGRGIARQVAIDFAADGARVAVVDLVPDRAQAVVKEILAVGGAAIPVVCDVRDEASVRTMVREVMGAHKRI